MGVGLGVFHLGILPCLIFLDMGNWLSHILIINKLITGSYHFFVYIYQGLSDKIDVYGACTPYSPENQELETQAIFFEIGNS